MKTEAEKLRAVVAAARPIAHRLFQDVALMVPEEQAEVVSLCDALDDLHMSPTAAPARPEAESCDHDGVPGDYCERCALDPIARKRPSVMGMIAMSEFEGLAPSEPAGNTGTEHHRLCPKGRKMLAQCLCHELEPT